MEDINPYEVLGISKDSDEKAIKTAYRNKAKEHHPDTGGNEEEFKKVQMAYEILSDPEKRKLYDTYGSVKRQPQHPNMNGPDLEDLVNMMNPFARRKSAHVKGTNVRINLKLTLEDIYSGVKKTLKYNRNTPCVKCDGNGGDFSTCTTCHGRRMVIETYQTPQGLFQTATTCPTCGGKGKMLIKKCAICDGTGFVPQTELFELNVPPGISSGDTLMAEGYGNHGKSGVAGDLHIVITELPHEIFRRDGYSLNQTIKLDFTDLVLGCKIDVPTIEGTKVKVTIPPYSNVGSVFRVQGKGLHVGGTNNRGDMFIDVALNVPQSLTDEQKELLKKFKKSLANGK